MDGSSDRWVVAITGASGVIYGVRLVEELLKSGGQVHLIVSQAGALVMEQELGWELQAGLKEALRQHFRQPDLVVYDNDDIAALPASGSFLNSGMVVIPCTMATLSAVAHGSAGTLIERAADVALKERRPLLVVPRETPLNSIHLRNMLTLSEMGVHVIPAMPGFYHGPKNLDDMVDFVVGKVLDGMGISHQLLARYRQ